MYFSQIDYSIIFQMLIEFCEGGALDDVMLDLEKGLTEAQIQVNRDLKNTRRRPAANIFYLAHYHFQNFESMTVIMMSILPRDNL